MTAVVNLLDDATPGLRERKKQRTRATLISAAVKLCLEQGYEHTTVDQIAAAAEVSPRTFSRYFATKDAVYSPCWRLWSTPWPPNSARFPSRFRPCGRSGTRTLPSWAGCGPVGCPGCPAKASR